VNLVAFLDLQVVNSLKEQNWTANTVGRSIEPYTVDQMISNEPPHIVLISPLHDENEYFNLGIREQFYAQYCHPKRAKIADAGAFTGSPTTFAEALQRIREYGSIPVVLSANQSYSYSMYRSYCLDEQTINVVSIDHRPDLYLHESDGYNNNGWLSELITHAPNYLFNYSLIGNQIYLSDPEMLNTLHDMNFDVHRLGVIRSSIESTEPIFRNADLLSFDVGSIRNADFQAALEPEPNGLYAEEACRLMRYAGLSNKLSSVGIFGWSLIRKNDTDISEKLVAQLIWHFVDGILNRISDGQIGNENDYTVYTLSSDQIDEELVFYKNVRNGRWWMKVPLRRSGGSRYKRHQIVPCNYDDYQQAMSGELPETWWQTYQKLT
jgi:formiminoglutamase